MEDLSHLKWLVGRYVRAVEDEEASSQRLLEAEKTLQRDRERRAAYAKTLKVEGIDPTAIPPQLLNGRAEPAVPLASAQVETEPETPAQATLALPTDNGQPAASEEQPVNKTHAVFLVMKKRGNVRMTADALIKEAKAAGYDLSRDDVVRVLGRQVSRELMDKDGDEFWLTPKGLVFDRFRRVDV